MCDLVPGDDGKIDKLRVSLNGEYIDAGGITTQVTKSTGADSFTRPYAMEATFSADIADVDVSTGVNWLRLEASDSVPGVGLTGFAEKTITVTASTPPVVVAAMAATTSNAQTSQANQTTATGPYSGWLYSVADQSSQQSGGGNMHVYYTQIQGPSALLDVMHNKIPSSIAKGPDGKFYVANPADNRPAANVGMASKFVREVVDQNSPAFKAGFSIGFMAEGVDMVWGTIKFVGLSVWNGDKYIAGVVTLNLGFESQWAADHVLEVNTSIDKAGETAKQVYLFVDALNQSPNQMLLAYARGDNQAFNKASEPIRVLGVFGIELIQAVGEEYQNSSAYEKGKMQGRVALQIVSVVIPATKVGTVSKLGFLTNLREAALFKNNPRLLVALEKVITKVSAEPSLNIGTEVGQAGDKIVGSALIKMQQGMPRRQAYLEAMREVLPNASEKNIASRLRTLEQEVKNQIPEFPTAADCDLMLTYEDEKALLKAKDIDIADEDANLQFAEFSIPSRSTHAHHDVPVYIQDALQDPHFNISIQNVDDCPVTMLQDWEHIPMPGGPGPSLHADMNAWSRGQLAVGSDFNNNYANATELLNELIRFYKQKSLPNTAKGVRAWAAKHGIPTTE
jgi:hypothetical protein